MIKYLYKIRIKYKIIKSKYYLIPSFCKNCGRDNHDFIVSDEIWDKVKTNNVLCYDCFCEICKQLNLPSVWKLNK